MEQPIDPPHAGPLELPGPLAPEPPRIGTLLRWDRGVEPIAAPDGPDASAAPTRRSGPVLGPAGGSTYYATRLWQLARLELEEPRAEELWREAGTHRSELRLRLGRDVGQRVALLDYILNVRRQGMEPQIIERAALERIEQQAIADSVTGLYNRHYFESALKRESERVRRYGGDSSLLLMDLDHFKDINTCEGHPVGDQVLARVGRLILHHTRAPDIPCRYGGDEFAVIFPDTPMSEALVVAERILVNIEFSFQREPVGHSELRVTSSMGVAVLSRDAANPGHNLHQADQALYDAKRAGGNRIAWQAAGSVAAPPSTGAA